MRQLLKRILLFFILCAMHPEKIVAQNNAIDSLKNLLPNLGEDTNKVRVLYQLGEQYWYGYMDYDSTFRYTNGALLLARKLNYDSLIIDANLCLGNINLAKHKSSASLENFSAAIKQAYLKKDKNSIARTYFIIAAVYREQENLPMAFENAFKALKLYEETRNTYFIAQSWALIGRIYSWQNNGPELEKNYAKALEMFRKCKETTTEDISSCYHFLGRAYLLIKDYPKALQYLQKNIDFLAQNNLQAFGGGSYQHIGYVYKAYAEEAAARGDKAEKLKMYREALANMERSLALTYYAGRDFKAGADILQDMADLEINLGDISAARKNIDHALRLADTVNSNAGYQALYKTLARVDSAEGNSELAYEHLRKYNIYRDSFLTAENLKKEEAAGLKYEFDKKEDSIKRQQIIIEAKLAGQKKEKYFYLLGLALLACVCFLLLRNYLNHKKIARLAAQRFKLEKTELELLSLRAQMNPHFTFNCINSIDAFIHDNDKYNATLYLNMFAKLLRNILDSSKQNTIGFSRDIETLKLYIELEKLRNDNKFTANFDIDNELLQGDYKVPPLIIQPFVENAILHGLRNRQDNNGILDICIERREDQIRYTVRDNGIGREAAGKIRQAKEASYGTGISIERIKLFNNEERASVVINDLYQDNRPSGTEIIILLKPQ